MRAVETQALLLETQLLSGCMTAPNPKGLAEPAAVLPKRGIRKVRDAMTKENRRVAERGRRANIAQLIDELGHLVPSGDMDKIAIISRTVQYIRHLKQDEINKTEQHTSEKLLFDQTFAERSALLANLQQLWVEESRIRQSTEQELEVMRRGKVD
ncbi:hypothetical protein B0H13DRAFT_1742686 [Mycena leptocephala]|nr:hypothetical protein B0H13DRAFT_1742686 [Mycena leptocephala]